MSKTKRVVITGMGIVSSIGNNVETVKNSLINQKSGIVSSEIYKEMGFRSQIHGEVKINLETNENNISFKLKNRRLIDRKAINLLRKDDISVIIQ